MTYLVFAGLIYYPGEGVDDCKYISTDEGDARRWAENVSPKRGEWVQLCALSGATIELLGVWRGGVLLDREADPDAYTLSVMQRAD